MARVTVQGELRVPEGLFLVAALHGLHRPAVVGLGEALAPMPHQTLAHPDADAQGFVELPNVDPQNEMVDLIGASRAYQANLTAISLIRDLVARSLDLGR